MNDWLSRIPRRYWASLALLVWGSLVFLLLHKTEYGINEGAARALLLVWSVVDGVVSPVVAFGVPDFRAIFFIPVGILWTGSVVAAKVFTLLVMAATAWSFYAWRQFTESAESALLATGVLLISPLVADQVDQLSVAPFLLFCFGLGAWLDHWYRKETQGLGGGLYFAQIVLCLISTTLHPAGLAYPIALAWSWYRRPSERKHQMFFLGGIAVATLLALLLTFGWPSLQWLVNPVGSLAGLVLGPEAEDGLTGIHGAAGSGVLLVLFLVVWRQRAHLWSDFLGRTLLIALVVGLPAADGAWSVLALTIVLYWGFPLLLEMRTKMLSGFLGQRGVAFFLLLIMCAVCMSENKARYQQVQQGLLFSGDELIKTLVENTDVSKPGNKSDRDSSQSPQRVASQWPGRTMLACRCDALPLPPPVKDEQTLLTILHGVNYLVFDPQDTRNQSLTRNLALLGGEQTETVAVQNAGVIVRMRTALPK